MNWTTGRARRLGLGLSALLLLAALGFVAVRSGPLAPVRVTVQEVASGSFAPSLFGIGTVEARRAYLIGPTSAARVRRVLVEVGDHVQAGQLLAEMEPVDLDERMAALDASNARARSLVQAAQAQRQDAVARQALADTNARRYVELGTQQFMSAGAVEAKLQEQSSAAAGLAAAEAGLLAARQELQRLDAERAGLRQQRANLRLLAPSAGLVSARDAETGSTVVAGQAVVRLIEPDSLWVRLRLDQGRSGGLALGLPAHISLRSLPEQRWAGRVARVEALSDSVTEERVALVSFERMPEGLSVGELAEVTLQLPATAPALLVAGASVKLRGAQTGVWRVEPAGLRFAPVRLGASGPDGQVQVLEGLQQGDRVVVYSERALDAGSRIRVVDALAASP